MTPLPLIDNTLFIDNSAIELITTCPRKSEYYLLHRRELAAEQPALRYGEIIHHALAIRYREEAANCPTPLEAVQNAQVAAMSDMFMAKPCETEGWRNFDTAAKLISTYNLVYAKEDWSIVFHEGRPIIEVPFAAVLGKIGDILIVYTGRIDLAVSLGQYILVVDHKTTSMLGQSFWENLAMSSQLKGYCWALRECFGQEPMGYVANVLCSRAPSKTGVPIELHRQTFYTREPAGQLEEWRENLLEQIETFLWHYARGYFPMHTVHCIGKYSKCAYYHVCELPKHSRKSALYSGAYKEVTWSPLNK